MATSYSNPGGTGSRLHMVVVTAAAGTFVQGSPAEWLLVDGDTASNQVYFPNSAAAGKSITFDFGTDTYVIDEAKWFQQNTTSEGVWKWQGSTDGTTWTDIGSSFTLGGAATQTITALNGNTTAYSKYRLTGVSGSTSDNPWIYEMQFKISLVQNRVNGTSYVNAGGSGNRSSGAGVVTVSVSRTVSGGLLTGADWLVDGAFNNATWFHLDPLADDYIRFDFGNTKLVDEAALVWGSSSPHTEGTFKWQGSNDASSWTDLSSTFSLGVPNSGPAQRFTALNSNTNAYRYYQMVCTAGAVASGSHYLQEILFRIGDVAVLATTNRSQVCFVG